MTLLTGDIMAMVLNPNPIEEEVAQIDGNRFLVYRNGRWMLLQDNVIIEGYGIPYSKLVDVPKAFTPAPHEHEREIRCNFLGEFAAGEGQAVWRPSSSVTVKGIVPVLKAAVAVNLIIDIMVSRNGGVFESVLTESKVPVTAGTFRTDRVELNIALGIDDAVRIDILEGAGQDMVVSLIYEE